MNVVESTPVLAVAFPNFANDPSSYPSQLIPLLRHQVSSPGAPTGHQARRLGILQEKSQPRARVRWFQGEVGGTYQWRFPGKTLGDGQPIPKRHGRWYGKERLQQRVKYVFKNQNSKFPQKKPRFPSPSDL